MKLLTIGSSPSAQIRINSEYTSSIHAELLLLDNGDIILTDKGSKNGTFVQNKQISPDTEINIRRGDNVRFADVFLDWTRVPTISLPDPSKVKGIYGVGSNYRNKYQISGSTVSRFHATIMQMKNGQWFIKDHSKNGTTVNGQKIMPDQDYRIRAKDAIVCGGVPITNPVPSSSSIGKISTIIAIAAVFVGCICLAYFNWDKLFNKVTPEKLIPASAYVYGEYYYVVTLKDNPFASIFTNCPKEYRIGINPKTNQLAFDYNGGITIHGGGTAFFISRDGKLVTNRHVACPWTSDSPIEEINQLMTEEKNRMINSQLVHLNNLIQSGNHTLETVNAWISRYMNSQIEISGRHDYIGIVYANHNYNSIEEFDRCTVIKESNDEKIDLGVLQLNSKKTPEEIKYIHDLNRAILNPKELKPQVETYYYIGYPAGLLIGLKNLDGGLQPTIHDLKISRMAGEYDFQFQGENVGGASGSPIINEKGQLIGVVWGKSRLLETVTLGVHAKYVKEMVDKIYQ